MKNIICALVLLTSIATPSFAQDNVIKGLYAGMPIEEFKDKVTAMGGSLEYKSTPESMAEYKQNAITYKMEGEVTVGGARIESIGWLHNYGKTHVVNFVPVDEDRKTAWEAVHAKYGRYDNYTPRPHETFARTIVETFTWYFDNNNRLEMTAYTEGYPGSIRLIRDDVKDGDKNDF